MSAVRIAARHSRGVRGVAMVAGELQALCPQKPAQTYKKNLPSAALHDLPPSPALSVAALP